MSTKWDTEKNRIASAETLGEHEGLSGSGPDLNPFAPPALREAWERGRKRGIAFRKGPAAAKKEAPPT